MEFPLGEIRLVAGGQVCKLVSAITPSVVDRHRLLAPL